MAYGTTVIQGPALITWNGITWFSQGDIMVNFSRELTHFAGSHVGRFDSRHKSAKITITFTPIGRAAEVAGALMSLNELTPGQSLVPGGTGVELPLVIKPIYNGGGASRDWTFTRAGLTGIGDFTVSSSKVQPGALTFTALESIVSAGTWFTTAGWSATPTEIDDLDTTTIYSMPCRLVWAANPASLASGDYQLHAVDGWTVSVNLSTNDQFREAVGIADVTLGDYVATVTGQAANWFDYAGAAVTEQSIPGVMPFASVRPGQRATRKQLVLKVYANDTTGTPVLSSGDTLWSFPAAELDTAALAWGSNANRTGNVKFTCIPSFTAGVRKMLDLDAQA